MDLKISKKHLDLIKRHGEQAYPDECCGFLLGRLDSDKQVLMTLNAANAREEQEKYHRFLITPENYLRCEKLARAENLDILGFYHSHPDAEARPSSYDLEHAWPWYSYLIVSVHDGKIKEVTSWVLEDNRTQFNFENICVV
ncbi:MAG: Mov34/MPN/PAD-1 family protein [bacterium]